MVEERADAWERERLIHDLEVHQAELESQNRQLREAQELLEESRARYAQLYDLAPVAYCTFDTSGLLLELNLTAARLFGHERQQLLGKPLLACATLDDKKRFWEHVAQCCRLRQGCSIEIALTVPGRLRVVVQIDSVPALDATGAVIGCRSTLTDITERKSAEEALRAALRVRENFLAVVSHDLRNPLNIIFMGAELLLRAVPAEERRSVGQRQYRAILAAAERMRRLVADLLDLSSMEAGHLSVHREPHDLRELLRAATDQALPLAQQKKLRLTFDVSEQPMPVECDGERIIQVLNNLLGNAVKFTPEGGSIVVQACRMGARARVTVRDSGPGVPTESRGHIFQAYWQADRSSAGKGLGLSIAKGLLELHEGKIWLEEARPEGGASFVVELPLTETRAVRETARRPPEPRLDARTTAAGAQLLIVDDEADAREILADVLRLWGYQVTTVKNGAEALAYLRDAAELPSLMLIDLVMPELDGWAFLRERQRHPEWLAIPVLLISGQADAQKTAGDFGLAGVVEKPALAEHVVRVVRGLTASPLSTET